MSVRAQIEADERRRLAPGAALAAGSRGRVRPEPEDDLRTVYMRDRDRIMHQAKAFRRLAGKTQVFVAPTRDHYRTRLSHTLEVTQIARTIARALALNEDLVEAIGLAHDLGHAPFGHAGEEGLDEAYRAHGGGFHHARHSLRVVDRLEREGQGLNLTWEVRNGIVSHSKGRADLAIDPATGADDDRLQGSPATAEAGVVRVADRIAYLCHDIDDALRAGVMVLDDLPADALATLGRTHSQRVATMVHDVVAASAPEPGGIHFSPRIAATTDALKEYLFDHVYLDATAANADRDRIKALLADLFARFMANPTAVPWPLADLDPANATDRARAVTDYLAGMTDRFARETYLALALPRAWEGQGG